MSILWSRKQGTKNNELFMIGIKVFSVYSKIKIFLFKGG